MKQTRSWSVGVVAKQMAQFWMDHVKSLVRRSYLLTCSRVPIPHTSNATFTSTPTFVVRLCFQPFPNRPHLLPAPPLPHYYRPSRKRDSPISVSIVRPVPFASAHRASTPRTLATAVATTLTFNIRLCIQPFPDQPHLLPAPPFPHSHPHYR